MVDVTECVFLYAQSLQQSGNKGKEISNGKFYAKTGVTGSLGSCDLGF